MASAPKFYDGVKDTSTTTGTGTYTLSGTAPNGYQNWSVLGDGNSAYYRAYDLTGGGWEEGIGTYTASGTTLSRDTILASSNSGSAVSWSAGTRQVTLTCPAFLYDFTYGRPKPINYAVNSDMRLFQRQAVGTTYTAPSFNGSALSTSVDAYGPDQWKVATQSATSGGWKSKQVDTNGSAESGLAARFYTTFQAQTTTKGVFYEPLEGVVAQALCNDGGTCTRQILLKASASKTIRVGVIQLNGSGTIDVIPAAIVPTTWGANSTDPTLATNLAYVTAGLAVPPGAQGSISGNGANCSVTTSWQQFAVNFTPPANAKNLLLAVWTDSQFAANDTLSIAQPMLTRGSTLQQWFTPNPAEEDVRCQRYCYSIISVGATDYFASPGVIDSTNEFVMFEHFPTKMRVAPTLVVTNSDVRLLAINGSASTPSASANTGTTVNLGVIVFTATSGTFTVATATYAFLSGSGKIITWDAGL